MNYEKLMKKCFKLAKKGKTAPNPMVGCVVLNKFGEIISTGYHKRYAENHAERDALLKLKQGEERGGILIVNLEPCNHYGKTPPCVDLIIEQGIKTVVISSVDTNPKASGGIEKLKAAGIEVIAGVLKDEGDKLNEIFFTNINKKRPFIALKTATTIDGKIATQNGDSQWITSCKSRKYAYKLRKQYDAILTSSNTVISDNPNMEHKTKIIIDRYLKTDLSSKIYKQGKCYIATTEQSNIDIETIHYQNLSSLMETLYEMGIYSVFVEAGGVLAGAFVKENLVDKIYHFVAPKILNDNNGRSSFNGDNILDISSAKEFKLENVKFLNPDVLMTYELLQP